MASQFKTKTHEVDSTPDITQLFFIDLAQTGWKVTRIYIHMRYIQLQGNNRVLKKRPPPILDEEQRFN